MDSFNFSRKKIALYVLLAITFLWAFYFLFFSVPGNFPVGQIVSIEPGMNLRKASLKLKEENIIRSRTTFEALMIAYGGERHLVSSDYLLESKLSVFEIARRMSRGESHLAPVKVVIPEGFDNEMIADTYKDRLSAFDKAKFLATAEEGYLFPDTYFFFTRSDEVEVLKSMSDNFERKVAPLREEFTKFGKSEQDIISMASIIEREAKGDKTGQERRIIAGILWRRISLGMPLQVDAAPETYKTKGLPESPICNPGLESIKATIHPTSSPYLYYLHDKDGEIHYAKTFTEHKANISKYLKK
ncbi:MAG: endolytic transglycosylase MltG [Candidatus Pacebacteria bacterium]|nr:endolytic transglycosylase MltG [Candidatus Paceibacterota bacterium]